MASFERIPRQALRAFLFAAGLLALDGLAMLAALGAGAWLGTGADLQLFAFVTLCLQAYEGLYASRLPYLREAEKTVRAVTAAFVIAGVTVVAQGGSGERLAGLALCWVQALWLLPLIRFTGKRLLAAWRPWRQRVLVVGDIQTGRLVLQAIAREPQLGFEVAGCLDDDPVTHGSEIGESWGRRATVLGGFEQAEQLIAEMGVQEVFLADGEMPAQWQAARVQRLQQVVDTVHLIPHLGEIPVAPADVTFFMNGRGRVLRLADSLYHAGGMALKRALDLGCIMLLLLPALPLTALLALAIKLDSPGPVLYADRRLRRGGGTFNCYKFRTMYVNGDAILADYLRGNPEAQVEWDRFRKLRSFDPRLTRVGRLLRKWSLDEIPQIANILRGEMSLVGPRPYRADEENLMGIYREVILAARPGITGLWQVMGRSEISFAQRLLLEAWYARNWSFWMDLVLLIRTVAVVAMRTGSY